MPAACKEAVGMLLSYHGELAGAYDIGRAQSLAREGYANAADSDQRESAQLAMLACSAAPHPQYFAETTCSRAARRAAPGSESCGAIYSAAYSRERREHEAMLASLNIAWPW